MTSLPDDIPYDDKELLPEVESDKVTSGQHFIHRIVVALDASINSRAALATAVTLAETLKTELLGLFVEDINLLRLSELPFAREVLFAESKLRLFETEELQKRLRARAAILRQEVQRLADEHKVTSSFQVIRGPIDKELLGAALDTDLLALGRLGHSVARRARLGSTARAIIDRATSAVLLVRADASSGPIVALYDGSEVGRRVLELAVALAYRGDELRILVWADNEINAFDNRQLAAQWLEAHSARVQYQHLSGDSPQLVLQWVNRQKASLLLLGAGEAKLPDHIFHALLEEAEQNILVIR